MPPIKRKRDLPESADYDLPVAKRLKVEHKETKNTEVTNQNKKSNIATDNLPSDTENAYKRKRSASEPADHKYECLENERRAKRARTAEPETISAPRPQDTENRVKIEEKDESCLQTQEKEDDVETQTERREQGQKKSANVEEGDVLEVQEPERVEKCDMSSVQETVKKAIVDEEDVQEPQKKVPVKMEENPTTVKENEAEAEENEGNTIVSGKSIEEETKVSASSGWASYGTSSTSAFGKAAGSASIFGSTPASKPVYSFGEQTGGHKAEECVNDFQKAQKSNIKGSLDTAFDTYAEPGGFAGLASQPSFGFGFAGKEKEWSGESLKGSAGFNTENSKVADGFGSSTPLGSRFATPFGTPSGFTTSIPSSAGGFPTQAPFGSRFTAELGTGFATPLGTPSAFTKSPLGSGFTSPFSNSSRFASESSGGFSTPFSASSTFTSSVPNSTCGYQTQSPFGSGFATPLGTPSSFSGFASPLSTSSGFPASVPSSTCGFQTKTPFGTSSGFAPSAPSPTNGFDFSSHEKKNEKGQSFNPFGPFQTDNSTSNFTNGFNSYPSPGSWSVFGSDSSGSGGPKKDEGSGGYAKNFGTSEGENTGGKGKTTGAFGSQASFGTSSGFGAGVGFGAGGPKNGAQGSSTSTGTSRPANATTGFGSYASEKSSSFGHGEEGPSVFGSKASSFENSTPEWSFSFDDDVNVDDYHFEDPIYAYARAESPKDEEQRTTPNVKTEKGYLKDGKIRMPDYDNIMTREEKEYEDAWTKAKLKEEYKMKLQAEKRAREAEKKAKQAEKDKKEAEAKAAKAWADAKSKAAEVKAKADESRTKRWNEYYGENPPADATHEYIGWGLDAGEFFSKSNCDEVRAGRKGCPFPKLNSGRCRLGAGECVKAQTLGVCQHDLLRVLKGSKCRLVDKIKTERNRWHPDKVNYKMGPMGKRWEVHAKEMFQMLGALAKKKY